jgi:mRNA interferase MazF
VLVVALLSRLGAQRYPMIVAAPLTTQLGEWVTAAPDLYPTLNAGMGGLVKNSAVMLEYLHGIDAGHIVKPLGALSAKANAPISASLEVMFGFRGSAA